MVQGKFFGSFHLVAPVATNSCGTFFVFMYFWIAEVGGLGLADHAVGGSRSAVRHDVADLDLGIGGAGVVFLLRERAAAGYGKHRDGSRKGSQSQLVERHIDLPDLIVSVSFLLLDALCG